MREDEYEVCIDSALGNRSLTYGECYLSGQSRAEVLISCHACHPSLCNDDLSALRSRLLARYLGGARLRYSYRFLFIPNRLSAYSCGFPLMNQRAATLGTGLSLRELEMRSAVLQKEPTRQH